MQSVVLNSGKQCKITHRQCNNPASLVQISRYNLLYEQVLSQQPKDKNKIYSLHEPQVYCTAKGKDNKPYEYGNKVTIASTAKGHLIVGVVSHERNLHDSHTLPEVLQHIKLSCGKAVRQAVCDRGYRGKQMVNGTPITLPKK